MEVLFGDARLKQLCETPRLRQRAFQSATADKLATRLDELQAAASMAVARSLPGKWEELTGDRRGQLSCRIDKKLRLIVRPTRQPPPSKPDGGLDWTAIDSVTVIEVVNYHD